LRDVSAHAGFYRPGVVRFFLLCILSSVSVAGWNSHAPAGSVGATTPWSTASATIPCGPHHARRITGWLHTCHSLIVDSHGRIVRPLSVDLWTLAKDEGNVGPPTCQPWAPPPPTAVHRIATWGFNSVLVGISWANLEPVPPTIAPGGAVIHHWNRLYLRALDKVVQTARANGLAVIFNMAQARWSSAFTHILLPFGEELSCGHGMPAWLYPRGGGLRAMVAAEKSFFKSMKLQREFALAWRVVAARYRDNPTVVGGIILHEAYDLLAQSGSYPGTASLRPKDLRLSAFYKLVGRSIHAANRHLLLLFPDQQNTRTKLFAVTHRPALPRAVYAVEFYAPNWLPNGHRRLQTYVERSRGWGLPLWVLEFNAFQGVGAESTPSPHWRKDAEGFLSFTKKNGIGWSFTDYFNLPFGVLRLLQQWL
jgi:hypothetical protein